jgi:hypothetical protein
MTRPCPLIEFAFPRFREGDRVEWLGYRGEIRAVEAVCDRPVLVRWGTPMKGETWFTRDGDLFPGGRGPKLRKTRPESSIL